MNDYAEIAQILLINNKFTVDAWDRTYMTPLHLAVKNCSMKVAQLLIHHGADVNAQDHSQYVQLLYASGCRSSKMFVENRASVHTKMLPSVLTFTKGQ
jgi:ankyrin repeat protein